MKILAIDTSCDETAAAVTKNEEVMSNIIWSQASLHAKFGGVVPSLAQRQHAERIDWVIDKALQNAKLKIQDLDTIAVTVGPGLAIALGVGIDKAKELAKKYKKRLIPINHIEAHLLSSFALSNYTLRPKTKFSKVNSNTQKQKPSFPAYGLVVSGGNTLFVLIKRLGEYKVLAQTADDALGEALDKGARMLGFGYPGGAVLEKIARLGKIDSFPLPIPMIGQEKKMIFSYSGLKTAMWRLIEKENQSGLNKGKISNLAASYQNIAFEHVVRIMDYYFKKSSTLHRYLLVGGGVAANTEFRSRIRNVCKKYGITPLFPYSKKLYTDNAAMVGVCAYLRNQKSQSNEVGYGNIDRQPNLKI